jgi:hypothetical protein
MKKYKRGCFLTLLISLTIIIAFAIYFFKNNKSELTDLFKPVVISSMKKEFNDKIDKMETNRYKDSLRIIVKDYLSQLKKRKDINFEKLKTSQFVIHLKIILDGEKIDSSEIQNLKSLLTRDFLKNERSEKNRN